MDCGYIKLFRKVLENPIICKDTDYFAIWHYLLYNATHKERDTLFGGIKIHLNPGQLVTGRQKIAKFFSINESKVRRVLNELENDQMIEQTSHKGKGRIITIVKWNEYQVNDQTNDQSLTKLRPNYDQTLTIKQECKNVKNDKNVRNIYIGFTQDEKLLKALEDFESMRKTKKKPVTDRAREILIGKLRKLSDDESVMTEIVEQSIERGWMSFFPIANEKDNSKTKQEKTSKTSFSDYEEDDELTEFEMEQLRKRLEKTKAEEMA